MSYISYSSFSIALRTAGASGATVEVNSSPVGELRAVPVDLSYLLNRFADGEEPPVDEAELRSLGVILFDSILPAPARALYRAALASLSRHSGLRLLVQTDSAHLAAIPWEYVYDSETGVWLALDPRTPLVRYYALPFVRDDRSRPAVLRALVILSAPTDLAGLDLDGERRYLEETFEPLQQAGRLELHFLESPVTVERLQNHLRRGYDILHYVGHGTQYSGQGALMLEREDRKAHLVLAEEVAMLVRRTGIRLVCLNACQTGAERATLFGGLGPALVQAEIPAVAAMQYAMPDQSALRFTRALYSAVADGEPVDAAITASRIALRTHLGPGSPEWGYPVLFMRAVDGYLWSEQVPETTERTAYCPTCGRSVAPTARFCGNCRAVQSTEVTPTCPRCGTPARAKANFCASCGADLLPRLSPQSSGGVQISGEATVTGNVAGRDVIFTQLSGDLGGGASRSSTRDSAGVQYTQGRRPGSAVS